MKKEFEFGQIYSNHPDSGLSIFTVRGAIGIEPLIDAIQDRDTPLDQDKKDDCIGLIRGGAQEAVDLFSLGGVITLDGMLFIKGTDCLNQALRSELNQSVILSRKGKSVRDYYELDVKSLGVGPAKRIFFVNEGAYQSLSYRLTWGGSPYFLVKDTLYSSINIDRIAHGLALIIDKMQPPGEKVIASAAIVRQALYDLALQNEQLQAQDSDLVITKQPDVASLPKRPFLAKVFKLFRIL